MTQTCTADEAAASALSVLRLMVAVADSTLTRVAGTLSSTQFRALRCVADRTPVTVGAVAQELSVNPSSVTRACTRLAELGLLDRAQNPLNRREVLLAPTARGRRLVEQVDHDRRQVLTEVLAALRSTDRAALTAAFDRFAAVADANLALAVRNRCVDQE